MKIWMIVAVCAFVFLVCFLVDTLFKRLFPKSKLERSKTAVRPARRSATFGVLLLFLPIVVLLFFMPEGGDTLLLVGCITALIVPGGSRLSCFWGHDAEIIIPWRCICQIGKDIILIELPKEKNKDK